MMRTPHGPKAIDVGVSRRAAERMVTSANRSDVPPLAGGASPQVLGIYVDEAFSISDVDGKQLIATDCAFFLFAFEVGRRFEGMVVFARVCRDGAAEHALPDEARLVALPYYRDLRQVQQVRRAFLGTLRAFWHGLQGVDVIWVFGPNPFAVVFVALALMRGRRVVLGIRQDSLEYFRARVGRRRLHPMLGLAWTLDRIWRLLARRLDATVVGAELARSYGPSAHDIIVSLVSSNEIARARPDRDWSGEITLLTVGRIDVEKDPFLTVELVARLQAAHPDRFRLVWVGHGPLEEPVRARIAELGLTARVDLRGYVAFGPPLLALYRTAHALVHVSLTEGVPQTIVEALACGTPVIASSVGGIPDLLRHGAAGLLVPPKRADALAGAVLRLSEDEALRRRLVAGGLAVARTRTLEGESERTARLLALAEHGPSRHR
jgi:glycosyltransferase involved in cell wall biosynthesis